MKGILTTFALGLLVLINLRAAEPENPSGLSIFAGPGYYAILPNKILLASKLEPSIRPDGAFIKWEMVSGPGDVNIERPDAAVTWASAKVPGKYKFRVSVSGNAVGGDTVNVNVYPAGSGFGNPLLPGMFPDPHILFVNDRFYIYATSMETEAGAYGHASVWVSEDFVNWNMKLTNWPEFGKFGGDIWAPDIIRQRDKFYQFVTRSGSYDTWIGVADDPAGPWRNLREDNTAIVSAGGNAGRIVPAYNMDAQPFIDEDGQAYMYWGWSESMAAKLTADMKDIDGEVVFLKGTKWLPGTGELPQWLAVDLGESLPISKITTNPEFREVSYDYCIEVSEDSSNWITLVERIGNKENAGEGYIDLTNGRGRFVRITMTECDGNWAGLYDFGVFSGDKKVSLNKSAWASSTRGDGSEAVKAVDTRNGPKLEDFVEGSYMIKRNGTYYLLYSTGALHDGSYSVHYAMGNTPLGPFTRPEPNIVIRMNSEKTTKGPGHNSILRYNDKYYIIYHQHNQPHEDGAGVFRQTCADLMEFNDDGTIREVTPTQTGIGNLKPLLHQESNIAAGKYATATSVKSGSYIPEFAFDNNNASKWCSLSNTYPQSLTVHLDGIYDISRIETSFEYPTLAYKYRIETSPDNKTWETYIDKTGSFPTIVSPQKDINKAKAAFVRITVTGCQNEINAAGIYELKIFGNLDPAMKRVKNKNSNPKK